ncbi:MAG: hypothetical protein KAQ66_07175 [Rhodospirillaceae bacterium]|nr:hypothetical protein [Rhodospirillaceae bacterium]
MNIPIEQSTLITCFLPKGKGHDVVKALHEERKVNTANVTSGRGLGTAGRVSFGAWAEFDILTVAVEKRMEDEIFAYIYEKADMHRPHGGLIFSHPLTQATPFTLPINIGEDEEA